MTAVTMGGFEITAPAEAVEGAHIILYGPPKSGKTSTLDDPEMKVLHIDLEGGSAVLAGGENVRRIDVPEEARKKNIHQFEVVVGVIKAVESGAIKGFDMYALDSLTQLETVIKDYIATKYAPNRKRGETKTFGDSAQADWGNLKDLITITLKRIHALTKRGPNSVHWIDIAHVGQTKDPVTEQVIATKIQLQGGNTAEVVMSIVDGIFYMYNKSRTITPEDGGKPKVEVERGIITKPMGIFQAGVRESKHKTDHLPPVIQSPVWSDIFKQMGYVRK